MRWGRPPGLARAACSRVRSWRTAWERMSSSPTLISTVSVSDGAVIAERAFQDAHAGYPVSFGTDLAGELYLCSFDLATVFRIVAT